MNVKSFTAINYLHTSPFNLFVKISLFFCSRIVKIFNYSYTVKKQNTSVLFYIHILLFLYIINIYIYILNVSLIKTAKSIVLFIKLL